MMYHTFLSFSSERPDGRPGENVASRVAFISQQTFCLVQNSSRVKMDTSYQLRAGGPRFDSSMG
jgi:hypothetical protein